MPIQYDNKRVIRPGTKHNWTDEMKQELLACRKDLLHFAMNHVKVQTIDQGVVPMEFRPYQEKLFKKFNESNRISVLQPRQSGKCCFFDTMIRLKSKKTDEIWEITIGEFFEFLNENNNEN